MKVGGSSGASSPNVDLDVAVRGKRNAGAEAHDGTTDVRPARTARAAPEGVSVRVSAAAQQRIDAAAMRPAFDEEKVERLRALLDEGRLTVDTAKVARRMLPDDDGGET